MEAKEISIQATSSAAGQPAPRWAGLQPGEVVDARVVAVNDDGTITIRLTGSLARLDSDALVAATGELPTAGSMLKLKCVEASLTPKLLLIATLLGVGEDRPPASSAAQAELIAFDYAESALFVTTAEGADALPPAVRQAVDALAASFRHVNLGSARVVVANLVKFAVPVNEENFNAVLNAASLHATKSGEHESAAGSSVSFAARAQMAAFLLSRGITPTLEIVDFLVPQMPPDAARPPHDGAGSTTSAPGPLDTQSLVELLSSEKADQSPVSVNPDQVKAMLAESEKLLVFELSLQVIEDLLRTAGESAPHAATAMAGSAMGIAGQVIPPDLQAIVNNEQAFATLLALFSGQGDAESSLAALSVFHARQGDSAHAAQVLKDAIAVILKDLSRAELQLLAGKLRAAEESEIVRALGLEGRKTAVQNEAATRNVILKALDIAAGSGLERAAHFELSLPTSGTASKARMRVAWREESTGKEAAPEPKQIVVLLHMSRLGRVLALADFSRPKALGVRFYVRDRAVRALLVHSQDELRDALARAGFSATISAAVSSGGPLPDPFEPDVRDLFQGGVDIRI